MMSNSSDAAVTICVTLGDLEIARSQYQRRYNTSKIGVIRHIVRKIKKKKVIRNVLQF